MKVRRRRSGHVLASVFMITLLMATLLWALVGQALQQIRYCNRLSGGSQAKLLAESAMAQAIAETQKTSGFASTVTYSPGLSDDPVAKGVVEFGDGLSVNNLSSDAPVRSGDQVIPAHSLYLVSKGTYLGIERRYAALIAAPAFPYSLASTGSLTASGAFIVGSLPSGADPKSVDLDSLVPAGLLCDGLTATLSSSAVVVGDAKTAGKFSNDFTVLKGGKFENISPEALPMIDITTYDPGTGDAVEKLTQATMPATTFSGLTRRAGALHITGDLTLSGGVLYVDGDLTIDGGVVGTGAIFATGSVTVTQASSLQSSALAAIVAKGDIYLTGTASDSSYFQGLVLSQGGMMTLHKVTVMGAAIGAGPSGTTLDVVDAKFFYDKKAVTINSDESFAGGGVFRPGGANGMGGVGNGDSIQLKSVVDGQPIAPTPLAWAAYLNGRSFQASDFDLISAPPPQGSGQLIPAPPVNDPGYEQYQSDLASAFNDCKVGPECKNAIGQIAALTDTTTPKVIKGSYNLSLNQFLKTSEQLHIVYCKSL